MQITLDGEKFELTREIVKASLVAQVPETIRDYWVDVDGTRWPVKQVISLATGVRDRQRFQSQSSRRWLAKLDFLLGREQLEANRTATPPPPPSNRLAHSQSRPPTRRDVVLVGCVKSKRPVGAPAKDLYTSDYFTKMRAYAEATQRPWFILSAEHGLVDPDEWLEPYERYLPDTSHEYRRAWGEKVAVQLEQAVGPLAGLVVDIHAGGAYVDAVEPGLQRRGAEVVDQLKGLSFGRRLSWYLHQAEPESASVPAVVEQLRRADAAIALSVVMESGGVGLRTPGMYSWWVDAAGAEDLSAGLGHPIGPGLVYAGLAGATRSGGSTSSNTLWGRIATMHLGGNHQFSTLRLSIGSILASAFGQPVIDEGQLTRWMHAHLRVNAIPVADVDSLGDVETEILAALDPPLNLAKVPKTPQRQRLSALRKQFGGRLPFA